MSAGEQKNLFRFLPSVEKVLERESVAELCRRWDRSLVAEAVSREIESLRKQIGSGEVDEAGVIEKVAVLHETVAMRVAALTAPAFRRVINATGIVVHTNLGRSPLPQSALDKLAELGGRYINLEFDLERGERGKRDEGIRRLLRLLFPGNDGLAVNNNAAAVLLALNTLAEGREVVISRGQIIEIGESFRINEIQGKSGARLVEVGTTNRTRLKDYEKAVGPDTALFLSVHPSNYRVVGFTAQVSLGELVELGRRKKIPVVQDWGSGCLVPPGDFGISDEESAGDILARGPDAVCFSGDKLLGGPQAGIIIGKPEVIERMRANHLYRALRLCKMTLIVLEDVLLHYLRGGERGLPTIEMLSRPVDELRRRAQALAAQVGSAAVRIAESRAKVGGGAAPEVEIPSIALEISQESISAENLKAKLLQNDPPIVARVWKDAVYLDLRTVFPDEDMLVAAKLKKMLRE
jgi:L-seryl-tRNA(Ser) seleniumtransferase